MTKTQGVKGLPKGINTDKGFLSFSSIHQTFSASKYGQILVNKIRFGYYKPKDFDNETWTKYLGYDVNNLHHLHTTYLNTREFLKMSTSQNEHDSFTQEEKLALLFSAIVHDWGESIMGDILLPLKTESDAQRERLVLENLFQELLSDQLSVKLKEQSLLTIFGDKDLKLARAFKIIEQIGYMKTAMRAWKKSSLFSDAILCRNFKSLTFSVFAHDVCNLINSTLLYNAVDHMLTMSWHAHISDAFDHMPSDISDDYANEAKRQWSIKAFKDAKIAWAQYLESKNI